MDIDRFSALVTKRWNEACSSVNICPKSVPFRVEIGPYPHFETPRGYAVAFDHGDGSYSIRFAHKTLDAPYPRVDGLLRHELGHTLDYLVPKAKLDRWGKARGVALASTPERRADDIARAVWGDPIRYDREMVQSTRRGVFPRPKHLGL